MAEGGFSAVDDGLGATEEDPESEEDLLHDYFVFDKFPRNTAVIYNDGNRRPVKLNYKQVEKFALEIQDWVLEVIDSWCVGVAVEMNHFFPSLQIGILRTGKAVCNMTSDDYCEATTVLKRRINLQYAILDRKTYMQNEEWIKKFLVIIDKYFLTLNQEQSWFYAVQLRAQDKIKEEDPNMLGDIPRPYKYAYVMQTTGTTGDKKTVLVPHKSIVPNIKDFISTVWECEASDVVFGNSPATFDPAIVELFTALGSGATILYVPNLVKLDGGQLRNIFDQHKVTIFPCTPSLFRRTGSDLAKQGMFDSTKTYLKVLCFGGENCPSKEELRLYINEKMSSVLRVIVNVYGVTEVSCWASFCKIKLYDDDRISLGHPLSETILRLSYDHEDDRTGEIVIESPSRVCTILNDSGCVKPTMSIVPALDDKSSERALSIFAYRTGDIGCLNKQGQIEFEDRKDDIIKRSGIKVPLHFIHDAAMKSGVVEAAHCVFFEDRIYLLVIPKFNYSHEIGLGEGVQARFLPEFKLKMLPPAFYPDCIVAMYSIPLNINGKIDMKQVLATIRQSANVKRTQIGFEVPLDIAEGILETMWKRLLPGNPPSKTVRKGNFIELGGKSLDAVKVIDNVFSFLKLRGYTVENENRLLGALFAFKFREVAAELKAIVSERGIPAEILEIDHHFSLKPEATAAPNPFNDKLPPNEKENPCTSLTDVDTESISLCNRNITQFCSVAPAVFATNKVFAVDLHMCIDAKVAIARSGVYEGTAVVGSYAGQVVAIALNEVQKRFKTNPRSVKEADCCLWRITLPDAVEAEATFTKNSMQVFIACHNNRLYAVSVPNGQITGNYLAAGTIRSKPLITDKGDLIVFVDDTSSVTCLDVDKLSVVWKAKIREKTLATYDLVVASDVVVLTTIVGGLIALSTINKLSTVWTSNERLNAYTTSPVGLKLNDERNVVVVGTVFGVKCVDIGTGKTIWRYREPFPVKHGLHPLIHKCDLIPVIEIAIITETGRVVIFNASGERMYEFYMDPTNSSPLPMCKHDLQPNLSLNHENDVYKHSHVFLSYPSLAKSATRNLAAYSADNLVVKQVAFSSLTLERESFSSIVKYKNLIIFGARDNKVHTLYTK